MIYFVQAKTPDGPGPVKIGYTSADAIWPRIDTLQVGCPWDLVVLRTTPGSQRDEVALHRRFAHLAMRGEWFRFAPELLEFALAQPRLNGTEFAPTDSGADKREGKLVAFRSHRSHRVDESPAKRHVGRA